MVVKRVIKTKSRMSFGEEIFLFNVLKMTLVIAQEVPLRFPIQFSETGQQILFMTTVMMT